MHSYKKKYKISTRPTHTEEGFRWATLSDVGSIKTRRAGYTAAYEHIARLFRQEGPLTPIERAYMYGLTRPDSTTEPTGTVEETPAERQTRRGLANPNRRARGYGNTDGYRF